MRPFVVNGDAWRVLTVRPDDPRLVDRTGALRIATADHATRTVCISSDVAPPLLDRVLMHEIAHAVTMSYGLLPFLRGSIPEESWVAAEEWAAQLMEDHAIEVSVLASESLGRPACANGYCSDDWRSVYGRDARR